ncbi:hypothetical protein [Tenacibaculum finnmarkense]|uniref:hypothetical protein n=1 Tax=Tenacibaculum finnmarkense TaxID=2781243 RepID=UPI000C43D3B9|nr:hypothetical protein [Tenacibaculum finnmarkense]MCD8439969.1 hypothetical protein [Tenacibaculum finnmarkense genomovar ulcerans]MCG8208031.1 hypothetical protein [Tenacibaculum finnmarkense genomovar finnmarkense]MCM8907487.1 hypothetical protein [Tenacibaculum finnmarkense genomovar finnmarkense]SOS56328.1 hypothetical protein TFHFJT_790002 [Tenacibaculum finnmarkense]
MSKSVEVKRNLWLIIFEDFKVLKVLKFEKVFETSRNIRVEVSDWYEYGGRNNGECYYFPKSAENFKEGFFIHNGKRYITCIDFSRIEIAKKRYRTQLVENLKTTIKDFHNKVIKDHEKLIKDKLRRIKKYQDSLDINVKTQ